MTDWERIFADNPRNPGFCLVLGPFGGTHDKVWDELAATLEENYHWTDIRRAVPSGEVMNQVLREIARTDVVILDITKHRPNVFYELGIAHVMKTPKKVIIVSRDRKKLPFDISGDQVVR